MKKKKLGNLQALKHDEARLVPHDRAAPSPAHLGDTVDAPDQDARVGAGHGVEEEAEPLVRPQPRRVRAGLAGPEPAPRPPEVVRAHEPEAQEHDDLQRDADDDDPVADEEQVRVVGAGGGGQGAADGLQDQARHVGRHEDDGVQTRPNAGERRVEREDHVFERQVDGDADQCRREDDGADLRLEGVLVVRVIVQLYAAYVSYWYRC